MRKGNTSLKEGNSPDPKVPSELVIALAPKDIYGESNPTPIAPEEVL